MEKYNDIIYIKITNTAAVFDEDFTKFTEIMEQYNEHVRTINYNHDIYNCKIQELKHLIHPTREIIEMKAHEKKLKDKTIQARKDYYINHIEELKEYINNIKTYESPQNKPVYNIDNAFTPEFIDFFVENTVSHIILMTSIKRVL